MINVDLSKAKLTESMESYKDRVAEVHDMIHNKTGAGNDFLGWVDLPTNYNKTEVENIKKKAAENQSAAHYQKDIFPTLALSKSGYRV